MSEGVLGILSVLSIDITAGRRAAQGERKGDEASGQIWVSTVMRVDFQSVSLDEIVFDLVGVDASIANALRRIILAEVPTVAIEKVWITTNTGIMQDEVLAHRLGLMPIRVDPRLLDYVQNGAGETDQDTLVFHLNVHKK